MARAREMERPTDEIPPPFSPAVITAEREIDLTKATTSEVSTLLDPAELAPYGVDPQPEPQTFPMDTAPRDKRWIEASRDGKEWFRVRFYETRTCVGGRTWMPVKCWTTSDPPKAAHRVEGLTMWRECSQW